MNLSQLGGQGSRAAWRSDGCVVLDLKFKVKVLKLQRAFPNKKKQPPAAVHFLLRLTKSEAVQILSITYSQQALQ